MSLVISHFRRRLLLDFLRHFHTTRDRSQRIRCMDGWMVLGPATTAAISLINRSIPTSAQRAERPFGRSFVRPFVHQRKRYYKCFVVDFVSAKADRTDTGERKEKRALVLAVVTPENRTRVTVITTAKVKLLRRPFAELGQFGIRAFLKTDRFLSIVPVSELKRTTGVAQRDGNSIKIKRRCSLAPLLFDM